MVWATPQMSGMPAQIQAKISSRRVFFSWVINTTIYGLNDRYRGVTKGRRVIFLNEADLERRGLLPGQRVDLTSHFEGETRRAEGFLTVPYDIPEGCAAAYYPETNLLVPIGSVAAQSNTPAFKSIVITVAPG